MITGSDGADRFVRIKDQRFAESIPCLMVERMRFEADAIRSRRVEARSHTRGSEQGFQAFGAPHGLQSSAGSRRGGEIAEGALLGLGSEEGGHHVF